MGQTTRREWMRGSLAAAGVASLSSPLFSLALPPLEDDETSVAFLDPQPVNPDRSMVIWERLKSWITPQKDFFSVKHYGIPEVDLAEWSLGISGLVSKPRSFTLEDLKARPRQEYTATLECSGNGVSESFMGAIGNAVWGGTPLAALLEECGAQPGGLEVVFFGTDQGTEKIRGNEYQQNFARSLSIQDAKKGGVLLAYEMNGKPLLQDHGAPLRLIVPGWYGVAWVKWLDRIELHDRRFLSRFMGRDYVTIRGEQRGDAIIWRETSVGKMNLKSIVARVTRSTSGDVRVMGAVWNDGTPLQSVQLRIDDGSWLNTELGQGLDSPHCWTFWSYVWKNPAAGEHTLVSRAIDIQGRSQPAAEDPAIALKKTYWEANQQVPRRVKL